MNHRDRNSKDVELHTLLQSVVDGIRSIDVILENKQFQRRVMKICRYYEHHLMDAEDLYQTIVLKMWSKRNETRVGVQCEREFFAWISTIARNISRDEWRRKKKYQIDDKPIEEHILIDSKIDPYSQYTMVEFTRYVQDLPTKQRWLLEKWVDGHPLRCIAKMAGCSHVTVQSQIKRTIEGYLGDNAMGVINGNTARASLPFPTLQA